MIGYFIRRGDKTSCGGHVLNATSTIIHHGIPVARVGDPVSCGKNPGIFKLFGGIQNYTAMGIPCVGTIEGVSSCPCKAKLFASNFTATYESMRQAPYKSPVHSKIEHEQHAQTANKPLVTEPAPVNAPEPIPLKREAIDAGFCIVDLPSNVRDFGNYLFYNPVKGARELYDLLNGSGHVKTGSILLLVDPEKQDPEQIETLKKAKNKVDNALKDLTDEEAIFLYKHKDAIDSFTGYGSAIAGIASEIAGKYFEEIEKVLKEIHKTYTNSLLTRGMLISEQFYVERSKHFKNLNILLNRFMKTRLGMAEYKDLRKALGLSSRSIMHHWTQTGVAQIEGYATYIEKSAQLVKAMKKLGYIGIALDFANTSNSIYEACTIGRESECKKQAFIEYGKFAFTQTGGLIGGTAGTGISYGVCMWAMGLATVEVGGTGALLCTAIGVGGGIAGGEIIGSYGGDIGSEVGMEIYEAIYDGL
jgi:uncharacterized Zn-binding protein involved in type VI secretion